MKTLFAASLLTLLLAAPTFADDAKKADGSAGEDSAVAQIRENPNDTAAINKYLTKKFGSLTSLINEDPDAAEQQLDALAELFDLLAPTEQPAKTLVGRGKRSVIVYRRRLELARITLEDLEKKLGENPDDARSVSNYISKISQGIGPLARSEPEKAEEQLAAAKKFLDSVSEKAQEEATKKLITNAERTFESLERRIASGKKLAAVIGKDAAPLAVEVWANGTPLTESDLKDKVVLLDFWAVWCGPCIRTFPHLRELREKYADKGLVIIGLTRYYNYTWDEEAGRAKRSAEKPANEEEEKLAHEKELKMLEQFAKSHDLHHRFAVQKDRSTSEYYGVTGIPHVVVLDQNQKVRLMRVGSGDANAHDVEEMIKKLLGVSGGSQE